MFEQSKNRSSSRKRFSLVFTASDPTIFESGEKFSMDFLLFATHIPFGLIRKPHSALSRSVSIKCCDQTLPVNQSGDPQWINLAKSIGPSSSEIENEAPSRPPPQWTYPEGKPTFSADEENPWHRWKSAQSSEQQPLIERDPKGETDFWRSTARDIVQFSNSDPQVPSNSSPDEIQTAPSPSASEDVWKLARGVTGDMTTLQNQLFDELKTFDSTENREKYRGIARDLIDPSNDEPWEDNIPVPPNNRIDVGVEWNPDVDWMRFDDVRRDRALAEEAAQRRSVEDAARQSMDKMRNSETTQFQSSNESQSDSDAASFGYDAVQSTQSDFTVDGKVPGFIRNRFRSSGTYGSSWSGAEEESKRLQKQGFELRDPRLDTEAWRSAAKELANGFTFTPAKESTEDSSDGEAETISSETSSGGQDGGREEYPERTEAEVDMPFNEDEGKLWSSWRQGNISWNRANAKIEERDPKKEVDMWRSSARELAKGENSVVSGVNEKSWSSEGDSGIWEQWRKANEKWSNAVDSGANDDNMESFQGAISNRDRSKMDWGAGLGKTNSERNAWENWNRVAVGQSGGDSQMWWTTRIDDSPQKGQNSNNEVPIMKLDDVVEGEKSARIEKNKSLDEWRSFAKEINDESAN